MLLLLIHLSTTTHILQFLSIQPEPQVAYVSLHYSSPTTKFPYYHSFETTSGVDYRVVLPGIGSATHVT
jgi:hypothetical protein